MDNPTAVLLTSPIVHLKLSYLPRRKMTDEAHTIHKTCKSILSWVSGESNYLKWNQDVVCSSSQTLSSGLSWAGLPLCRCKIQEAATVLFKILGKFFFSFCLCLCGWLHALCLFYGHMHAEGITARIFKETGAFSWESGFTWHLSSRNI